MRRVGVIEQSNSIEMQMSNVCVYKTLSLQHEILYWSVHIGTLSSGLTLPPMMLIPRELCSFVSVR